MSSRVVASVGGHQVTQDQIREFLYPDTTTSPPKTESPRPSGERSGGGESRDPRADRMRGAAQDDTRTDRERLEKAFDLLRRQQITNTTPLLPLLFNLRGSPLTLRNFFLFEPLFSTAIAPRSTICAGRQVSKSSSLASRSVVLSATMPYFNTLYVAPLFEMTRRFSSTYVKPLIDDSPVRRLFVDSSCNQSVLQRSFKNRSIMFFSFAYLDPNRTRGVNADLVNFDEIQDMDPAFIPIIAHTTSGSKYASFIQSGTAKSLDGPLEHAWQNSSQAQWHIWCGCGYENIPAIRYDLDAMLGPNLVRRKLSEESPGLVCAKCGHPLQPRTGRWVHHYPDRRLTHPGYHIPQPLMPMHYADNIKWATLLGYRQTNLVVYHNEVCGESYDLGSRLVTQTELKAACDNRPNCVEACDENYSQYIERVVVADWGGGGEDEISRTVLGTVGMRPDGVIDVVFAKRFVHANQIAIEARAILDLMKRFRAPRFVHDFLGQGASREALLEAAGLDPQFIMPISYIRASRGPIMRYMPQNPNTEQRSYYQVDKARSLVQTCQLIKYGRLRFFEYDYRDQESPGLINEFLSLVENVIESRTGMDVYTVIRSSRTSLPDDFAQMVNMASCALFYLQGTWPRLAELAKLEVSKDLLDHLWPSEPNWEPEWEFD